MAMANSAIAKTVLIARLFTCPPRAQFASGYQSQPVSHLFVSPDDPVFMCRPLTCEDNYRGCNPEPSEERAEHTAETRVKTNTGNCICGRAETCAAASLPPQETIFEVERYP